MCTSLSATFAVLTKRRISGLVFGAKQRLVLRDRRGDLIRLDERERPAGEYIRECDAVDRGGDVVFDAGERAVLVQALDLLGDVALVDGMVEVERHPPRERAPRFAREPKMRHRQDRHRPRLILGTLRFGIE